MPGLYNTANWQRLRERQLRLQPCCVLCRQVGRIEPATVVDHVEAHRGNPELFFAAENLQSLCKTCHDAVKQSFEKTGRLRGSDLEGIPLDPKHPWFREVDE